MNYTCLNCNLFDNIAVMYKMQRIILNAFAIRQIEKVIVYRQMFCSDYADCIG